METRSYRRRGTADFPVAYYWGWAGKNMRKYPDAEYHPEIEITRVVEGNVTTQIGGINRTFGKGDIYIIPPNTVHCRTGFSDDASIRTLVFSTEAIRLPAEHFFQKEFAQPLADGMLEMPTLLQPGHPSYDGVRSQMEQMENTRLFDKDYKPQRFSLLIGICTALMPACRLRTEEKPVSDPGNEAVRHCMLFIHDSYNRKVTLEAIAKRCHLNPSYLCTVFKQYTGETVFEYLNRIRVERAADLLRREDLPVGKVAELAGFHSECHFYKKFKQLLGTTPIAYRKQHTQEK